MQGNNLDGEEDLRRVQNPLCKKHCGWMMIKHLTFIKSNSFSLDIDKFLKTEPGAIYRVTIGFRPDYSLYTCHSDSASTRMKMMKKIIMTITS